MSRKTIAEKAKPRATVAFAQEDGPAKPRTTINDRRTTANTARRTTAFSQDGPAKPRTTINNARRTTLAQDTRRRTALTLFEGNRQKEEGRISCLVLTEADRLLYGDANEALGAESEPGPDARRRRTTVLVPTERDKEAASPDDDAVKLSPRDVNLIFLMPFWCTIATRLPFIYFVIELKESFGLDLVTIGLLIGAFHLCRVIAIAGSIVAPKASHLAGSVLGIVGYACLFAFANTSRVGVFACCNIAAGLAEASAAVFVYSKQVYSIDVDKLRMAMSNQSAFIGVAVILGFFFGGMSFQVWGVAGIAVAGIIVLGLELLSLLYFLVAPPLDSIELGREDKEGHAISAEESGHTETAEDGGPDKEGGQENDVSATKFRGTKLLQSIKEGKPRATVMKLYSGAEEIVASRFTYLVAIVFSIESIACGYLFSIGPLFIYETFGVVQGKIGTIYSTASLFGTILTFLAISPKGRACQRAYLRSPYNLYILISTITLSVLGLLIPSFPVQVICILFLIGACELFLTLLSELQGSITTSHYYAVLGPSAQMLRRIMNVCMAVTGPILYGVLPRLPYIVAGLLCVVYVCVFVAYTQKQLRQNSERLAKLFSHNTGLEEEDTKEMVRKYNRMTMASRECLARMASCTMKVLDQAEGNEGSGAALIEIEEGQEKAGCGDLAEIDEEESEEGGSDDSIDIEEEIEEVGNDVLMGLQVEIEELGSDED